MGSTVEIADGDRIVLAGAALTLALESVDATLVTLCREVLRELEDTGPNAGAKSTLPSEPIEVCIWDYECGDFTTPSDPSTDRALLYLVSPARLDSLLAKFPQAEGRILLKPLTRAVLRSFLVSVIPEKDRAEKRELLRLREGRDDLLQHLLQANLRLQEYDQQRTNFIARAVHDFRAPLTALSGFCSLLASGQLGPLTEQQREALGRMGLSAKRLTGMASAMFELSVGPKVNRRPELLIGDIREQIRQALHEIHPIARERQILIKADHIEPPLQPLRFDGGQIEQVLLNLLDNACKFTHRKGHIEIQGYPYFWERRFLSGGGAERERRVKTVPTPNSYRVDIRDTGPGIPANCLSHIFEEYTSYSGPHDRSGAGLGLAICRLILSNHGGHIWANSYSTGAIFSFVLPHNNTLLHSTGSLVSTPEDPGIAKT